MVLCPVLSSEIKVGLGVSTDRGTCHSGSRAGAGLYLQSQIMGRSREGSPGLSGSLGQLDEQDQGHLKPPPQCIALKVTTHSAHRQLLAPGAPVCSYTLGHLPMADVHVCHTRASAETAMGVNRSKKWSWSTHSNQMKKPLKDTQSSRNISLLSNLVIYVFFNILCVCVCICMCVNTRVCHNVHMEGVEQLSHEGPG